MRDKRVLGGELVESGNQSINCKLTDSRQDFTWFITGVYGSNCRMERLELWWELAAIRGMCNGPWVICGDINTTRFSSERSNNHILEL